jgi:nucleoside-diphosphate-sugar epimerase
MNDELHIVIGANGNAGNAILERLVELGKKTVSVTRNGKLRNSKFNGKVNSVSGDILNGNGLAEKIKGATHIYNAVNPPYYDWADQLPTITENFIQLAKAADAKLIVVDNLYMYDPDQTSDLRESTANTSPTKKGKLRSMIAQMYLDAHGEDGLNVVLVRGSDFYGPGVLNAALGDRFFPNIIKGKKFMLFGDVDQPHTFTYMPDFAKSVINISLADNKEVIYHAPNAKAISQNEIVSILEKELGKQLKYSNPSSFMVGFFGLFDKMAREFKEMLYQFNQEFRVNHSHYTNEFGNTYTEIEEGLKETLNWYKTEYIM